MGSAVAVAALMADRDKGWISVFVVGGRGGFEIATDGCGGRSINVWSRLTRLYERTKRGCRDGHHCRHLRPLGVDRVRM
jgi:hypothetical protein